MKINTEVSYIRPVSKTWFAYYTGYDDWELKGGGGILMGMGKRTRGY